MATYISLLRGINVSGKNPLKMPDLLSLYQSLGLAQVRHYLQSGNVLFTSAAGPPGKLARLIQDAIQRSFALSVPVLVVTPRGLEDILRHNPFPAEDSGQLYLTFLFTRPDPAVVQQLEQLPPEADRFAFREKVIYLSCPGGYGQTRFSTSFFERKLGLIATTRNWKTLNALVSLSSA